MRTPQRARYRALLPRCADTAASARRRHQLLGHRNGVPHLHRDWAHRCHICTRTGLTPATSAQGLGPPQPHLHRDWAHPCHICTGTGFRSCNICTATGPPRPHLHRDLAHPGHICTGTGLFPAPSAPGLGSFVPHLRDSARRCHICGNGLTVQVFFCGFIDCLTPYDVSKQERLADPLHFRASQPHARRSLEQH